MATVTRVAGRYGRTHRRTVACAALAVAGLLAGCSGQPGAAAVVEGTSIPVSAVQDATAQLEPLLQGVTPSNVLSVLVQEPTLRAVGAEHGVAVSDQAARAQLTDAAARLEVEPDGEFGEGALAVSRYLLLRDGLTGLPDADAAVAELQEALGDLDVQVNPRFGAVGESNELVEVDRPWIVASEDEAAGQ